MTILASRRARAFLALSGTITTLLLALLTAPLSGAQAEGWTNYCNNQTLAGKDKPIYEYLCQGVGRTLSGLMGEGDQHSVCIWDSADSISMCTSGPNAWVYNPGDYGWDWAVPYIANNAYSPTVVHAVAWTP
jgi:hypothetical protein